MPTYRIVLDKLTGYYSIVLDSGPDKDLIVKMRGLHDVRLVKEVTDGLNMVLEQNSSTT